MGVQEMPSAGNNVSAEIKECVGVSQMETKKRKVFRPRKEPWAGSGGQ